MLDHLQPAARQAVGGPVVEPVGDLALDQVVEGRGLQFVTTVGVVDAVGGGDGPAVVAVVPLVPPAVADRQVQAAVERGLHAGGAARLQRAQRVVHPDVDALDEELADGHVVVGQEDDAVAHVLHVGELDDLLDELLAALVGGVGLAGDHDLDRLVRVEQQRAQPLGVAQHQREPLVGRHPAGEADGQHVGREGLVGPGQLGVGGAALPPRLTKALAGVVDQVDAELAADGPQVGVGELLHALPALGAARRASAAPCRPAP